MSQLSIYLSTFVIYLYAITVISGSESVAEKSGLWWCDNFCLCPRDSDEKLKCLQAMDIYSILNFNPIQIRRLSHVSWDPIASLKWCDDSSECFCNKESNKLFACNEQRDLVANFVGEAAESLPEAQPTADEDGNTPILRTAGIGGSVDSAGLEVTPGAGDEDSTPHRRRDMDEERRNRRRNNRKNRRNKKRNRNGDEFEGETLNSSENFQLTDESEVFDEPQDHEDVDYTAEPTNMLPKQEAINSSPMVTAMQPPTRRQPMNYPPSTTTKPMEAHHGRQSSANPEEINPYGPLVQESSHPGFQHKNSNMPHQPKSVAEEEPIREVPLQRKTVAGRVSEDLKHITEDVQHIRSDVIFNQRILLVTVAVAGVAMLGVLILALHACCSKRSSTRRARITENGGRHDDNHHLHHPSSTVTKVNIDEAW